MQQPVRIGSTPAAVPADAPVAWVGGPPVDEDARVVWEAVTRERQTRYGPLVEWVGEQLFRRDRRRLGCAADIGFFRSFYVAHARELVRRLDGTALRVGRRAAS